MHTIVTLHSGALERAQNSWDYLELAAATKPDVVEVDVRCTADNFVILNHDSHIKDMDSDFIIAEHSLKELLTIKPGLITLSDAMKFCFRHKLFMNLDIKESNAVDAVVQVVKNHDMTRNILFSGCREKEIMLIRQQMPNARVLLNVEDQDLDCKGEEYTRAVEKNVYSASEMGCCGLNVNYEFCRNELVQYARTRSLPLMIWTVDDEEQLRKFISMGVYSITTNRIDLFHKIRNEIENGE